MMHWQTVSGQLRAVLQRLMSEPLFAPFRLVGGTALSLQLGHRASVDIDLFTDAAYGSVDFKAIDSYLRKTFNYVYPAALPATVGMGQSYIIGSSETGSVKLDLYYTDAFKWACFVSGGIRMASQEEIAAMKMDIVQRLGRKKDFWDLHKLMDTFSIDEMVAFHEIRYPYSHDQAAIWKNLVDFSSADNDFDPECLEGKHWELIKLDIVELLNNTQ